MSASLLRFVSDWKPPHGVTSDNLRWRVEWTWMYAYSRRWWPGRWFWALFLSVFWKPWRVMVHSSKMENGFWRGAL